MVTDGVNSDYFQLASAPVNGTLLEFDAAMVGHSYVSNGAKVQLLRDQDPDAGPSLWFSDVDMVIRHGIKSLMSSIDFSS
jgi:hypothetical protein